MFHVHAAGGPAKHLHQARSHINTRPTLIKPLKHVYTGDTKLLLDHTLPKHTDVPRSHPRSCETSPSGTVTHQHTTNTHQTSQTCLHRRHKVVVRSHSIKTHWCSTFTPKVLQNISSKQRHWDTLKSAPATDSQHDTSFNLCKLTLVIIHL